MHHSPPHRRAQGDRGEGVRWCMARPERYPQCTVRYLPLGSPCRRSKRSYVHVPVCVGPGVHDAQNGGVRARWVPGGWYTGYQGTGSTPPRARVRTAPHVQAPRSHWARSWGLPWAVLGRVPVVSAAEVVARWVRQGRLQGRLQHPQHGPTDHIPASGPI